MEAATIAIIVIVLVILYYLYSWLTSKKSILASYLVASPNGKDGSDFKPNKKIPANKISRQNGSNNFTYSFWLFIDDWNYRFGEEKTVFVRHGKTSSDSSPKVSLGTYENNLNIALSTYAGSDATGESHNCNISNIPLQKWFNVIISVYGRTLDVYLDGKLVRTCVLPGTAKVDSGKPIVLFPGSSGGDSDAGFGGKLSNFEYWPNATNPQEAWNIYRQGYGSNIFGNFLDKYRLQVSFLADGVEKSSFQI